MTNEEIIVEKLSDDLKRIYKALCTIKEFGGSGSVEVHIVKGKIRTSHGLYIKPGFHDEELK